MKKEITVIAFSLIAFSTLGAITSKQVVQMDKKDGKVSRAEYVAYFTERFDAKDKNKDGVLTPNEFPFAASFKSADKNKNGKLTKKEYSSIYARQFDNAHDKNKDGFITVDETAK